MHSSYYIIPKLKCQMVNIHQTTSLSVVAKLALPQSKLCNYSSANLSGSLVGEAKASHYIYCMEFQSFPSPTFPLPKGRGWR